VVLSVGVPLFVCLRERNYDGGFTRTCEVSGWVDVGVSDGWEGILQHTLSLLLSTTDDSSLHHWALQ
jgi:hypothetical protein